MTKPTDTKLFDQRTVKRNIQQGLIKEEDYQKFLKSLPDEKNNCEEIPFEEEETENALFNHQKSHPPSD